MSIGVSMLLAPSSLRAEDEVRIALVDATSKVELRGLRLALYDGLSGRRLWAFGGRGTAVLVAQGSKIQARGAGPARDARYGGAERFFAEAEGPIQVERGVYFGRVEVRLTRGQLAVSNRLPLETYLLGIVGSEMSASWPLEALKAQAVAARTYALQRVMMSRAANRTYDLAATVVSQVYRGAERIAPAVIEAVKQTRGEVIAYDRMLVEALFHSTCGGETVAAEDRFSHPQPYLVPRPCTWCQASSRYRWQVKLARSTVEARLRRAGLVVPPLKKLWGGGPEPLRVEDGRGRRVIAATKVRKALGWNALYSERFVVRTGGRFLIFEGRGFGHGVGMCQWGAKGMADAGYTYRQILEHFYAGATVRRIY